MDLTMPSLGSTGLLASVCRAHLMVQMPCNYLLAAVHIPLCIFSYTTDHKLPKLGMLCREEPCLHLPGGQRQTSDA